MLCYKAFLRVLRDEYLGWLWYLYTHTRTLPYSVLRPFRISHNWIDVLGRILEKSYYWDAI